MIKLEICWSRDHGHAHLRGCSKYFLRDVKGMLCSKFCEDRFKTGLTILAVVAGWTDTGRTLKWILYSAQCSTLYGMSSYIAVMFQTMITKKTLA